MAVPQRGDLMYILGIWDGHDAGAAIVKGNKVLAAVNEERFSKLKLHVGFPYESIKCCLSMLNLRPNDIHHVAVNTADLAKTLTRIIPSIKQRYYLLRRRKVKPSLVNLKREFKYRVTEIPASRITKSISEAYFRRELSKMGFRDFEVHLVEHHTAHASAAAFTSGFKEAVVITLDGVGDGLSGTVSVFKNGRIKRISEIPAKASLGIFFEQATNLLGMRELEDEGKVMALSDYSYGMPESKNPLIDIFRVDGLSITTRLNSWARYKKLYEVCWRTPSEDFAFMVQKTLEKHSLQLFSNAIKRTRIKNVAWSGGVASNVKNNMRIRRESGLERWYVFPHMGDGGLALGSAMHVNHKLNGVSEYEFKDVYLGPEYSDKEILQELKKNKKHLKFSRVEDISAVAADAICKNEIVMWYQGRLEFGPRALGNRSILASAYSREVKDRLNVELKRRDWFQPFCPTVLAEDAPEFFEGVESGLDRFMTMGYMAKPEYAKLVVAVLNVDGSARPQMLQQENPKYRRLIELVKQNTGHGIVLNTSFNIHGFPIVNSPADALGAMRDGKAKYIAIGNYWVEADWK